MDNARFYKGALVLQALYLLVEKPEIHKYLEKQAKSSKNLTMPWGRLSENLTNFGKDDFRSEKHLNRV